MTSKGQITKIASRDGVDARVVERDYVLVHAVALISAHDTDRTLIFKGGTSLRLLHFEEYRYSADLDYSVVAGSEEQARELIRGALAQKLPDTIKQLELTEDGIAFVGPLGASRTIKLDLADDELVGNTEQRPLLQRWADTPGCNVVAYTKLEIAAEKLRCILQRRQCRDFLDLDLLLGERDLVATVDLFARRRHIAGWTPPRSRRNSRSASTTTRAVGMRSSISIWGRCRTSTGSSAMSGERCERRG
jgi:predicted nucleotidyltransferase component of viral defense system